MTLKQQLHESKYKPNDKVSGLNQRFKCIKLPNGSYRFEERKGE